MPSSLLPITNPKSSRYSPPAMPPPFFSSKSDDDDDATTRLIISSYDDDKATLQQQQIRPLVSRTSSYSSAMSMASSPPLPTIANGNQRRRRISSDSCLSSLSGREEEEGDSLVQEVEHAAAETLLITRLSLKLLSYLGVGYRWITRFMALGCYAFMLMPGFIQVGYSYFFSRQIRRGIVYGDLPRNRLDLYLPKEIDGPRPVIAFITGGAWIIGYKAWGSLLGQQLSERGVIVACIDYRNFPQGTISDMVADASKGISFVCNKIAEYGGDPNRIYVMGQSAGAHIAACTLVEQAIKEFGEGDTTSWSLSQIKTYFGLSGGYNLLNLVDHFHQRGLYRSIFLGIMEGEQSLARYSPELMAKDPNVRTAVSRLPPFVLFHGTADYSIPSDASKSFADTLQGLGAKAESILYEGKTHTDLFLQDPMRGGTDDMLEDLVNYIYAEDAEALAKIAAAPPRRRMVPEFMLKMARSVSPF